MENLVGDTENVGQLALSHFESAEVLWASPLSVEASPMRSDDA